MPVQMMELEEVQMVETTDEALESSAGGLLWTSANTAIQMPCC